MKLSFSRRVFRVLRAVLDFGILQGAKMGCAIFFNANVRITPKGYGHSFLVRGQTTDAHLVYSIFQQQGYDIPKDGNIGLILDLGANVGYSAILFAHHYPNARVVALEPQDSNFEALCMNTEKYENIFPVHAGVWWRNAKIMLENPHAESWGYRFVESKDEGVSSKTIDALITEFGTDNKVMVKMDIEGAEKEIFEKNPGWLSKVSVLQLEIHGCWQSVFDALNSYRYEAKIKGENVVLYLSGKR